MLRRSGAGRRITRRRCQFVSERRRQMPTGSWLIGAVNRCLRLFGSTWTANAEKRASLSISRHDKGDAEAAEGMIVRERTKRTRKSAFSARTIFVCCWRKLWACILAQIADAGDGLLASDPLPAGAGYGREASSPLRGSLRCHFVDTLRLFRPLECPKTRIKLAPWRNLETPETCTNTTKIAQPARLRDFLIMVGVGGLEPVAEMSINRMVTCFLDFPLSFCCQNSRLCSH